jgi:acyl CoA:acetate/3-ketoacid CoA transferase beta subunit
MVRRRHHHRINVLAAQQVAEVGNARNTAIGAGAVSRRIGLLDLLGPLLPAVREAIADGGALRIGMFEKS